MLLWHQVGAIDNSTGFPSVRARANAAPLQGTQAMAAVVGMSRQL